MTDSKNFHMNKMKMVAITLWSGMFLFASEVHAEDLSINITIKDHRFYPSVSKVPAGVAFKIVFINTDKTSEDPASESMCFEKTVAGGSRQVIQIDPLQVGSYNFFGQFSRDTAQGTIIAE
ncbi:hypothetical protein DTO96_100243 [Ephemeroptericola cinctiostellae]|uniref:EfeO-type cupredoxin-like domain-containing protein n=2 Tax=Ephemeroptericola cinctiostellae TaxID=2268024 RepID=A0A345D846_9BURK|nr:hypothetical protein DTO96_100243 [Ephemeroptericola cinctiostellae]